MAAWNPQANDIFLKALEIEQPQERRAFLESACAREPGLRHEVEELLQASEQAGTFLESPARALEVLDTIGDVVREGPGSLIGPYKLLEQIGEGGFGLVFMAEQQQPVRRKVAVKVLKPGMDTRQVIARFEAERQALALMDHANIARVLDAGATPQGRPFFVMELVRGVPITEYCDHNQLAPKMRLELFLSVCQAVQHAHQRGIIHRDIKPSNVLVTLHDGVAVVKIIDFGIAKAMGQQLTDKTLFTGFAQMIGTPLYMSPEQAEMSGFDIDTRTDIYSLGVLLYELLTGTTPFDKDRLRKASYEEIRRTIREEEPLKPSTRLSTLEQTAAAAVSAQRKSNPKQLTHLLQGELDWIVMKALEKDCNRRFETASALARDVQRYLNDEPVEACPPSAWYRFRKLAKRNKAALVMAGTISATLVAAVVGLLIANYQTNVQIKVAQREHDKAEANQQKARKAVDYYFTTVSENLDVPGLDALRKQLLETALNYYEDFIREYGNEAQLQADVAAAHFRVAQITYLNGANADQYFQHLRDGVEISERLIREHRDTPEVQRQLAGLYLTGRELDVSFRGDADPREIIRYLLRLAGVLEKFATDNPDVPEFENDLAGACRYIAQAYSLADEALPWFEKAIALWEKLARGHPGVTVYRENLARAYELCSIYQNMNKRKELAEQFMKKALTLRRELAQDCRDRPSYRTWLAISYRELAEIQNASNHSSEAEENLRQALAIQQKLVAELPTLPTHRHHLAQTELELARVLKDRQRSGEAATAYRHALVSRRELVVDFPMSVQCREEYVGTVPEVVSFLTSIGQPEEGVKITREATNTLHEAVLTCLERMQSASLSLRERLEFAEASGAVAAGLRVLHQAQEADQLDAQTIAIFEKWRTDVRANVAEQAAVARGYVRFLEARGNSHAAWGQWHQAINDYARLRELDPGNDLHWYLGAALCLYIGDTDRYRQICSEMLERFGDTRNPNIAERTAKTCSLAPQAVSDPERVLRVADEAVRREFHGNHSWFVLAKALADYRAGRFASTVDWLKHFSPRAGGIQWDASALAILAMAKHHLGEGQEAGAAFDSAQAILAKKMPDPKKDRPFGREWWDWLHAQILCREAEALIGLEIKKANHKDK